MDDSAFFTADAEQISRDRALAAFFTRETLSVERARLRVRDYWELLGRDDQVPVAAPTIARMLTAREIADQPGAETYGAILRAIDSGKLVANTDVRPYRVHPDRLEEYRQCRGREKRPESHTSPAKTSGASSTADQKLGQAYAAQAMQMLRAKLSKIT